MRQGLPRKRELIRAVVVVGLSCWAFGVETGVGVGIVLGAVVEATVKY